jgi:predicted SprT family Zn-dependent metalloprotease
MSGALRRWQRLWSAPGLARRVSVRFSARLHATAGRCALAKQEIVLSAKLLDGPEAHLLEVFCHEAAHLAVHLRHGRLARLHGTEWSDLVRKAGFEPTRRLGVRWNNREHLQATRRYVVLHTCPVCQTRRLAKRAVPQWRCAECVAAGLPGRFVITRGADRM